MPDKVQHVDGKAREKDQEQSAVYRLFLHRDLPAREIQQEEDEHRDTAVNIRPVVQADLSLHVSDMAGDHVEDREVGTPGLRKIKIAGRRTLKCADLRQQHRRRKPTGEQGIDPKPDTVLPIFFDGTRLFHDQERDKVEHHEQAGHNGDIVV